MFSLHSVCNHLGEAVHKPHKVIRPLKMYLTVKRMPHMPYAVNVDYLWWSPAADLPHHFLKMSLQTRCGTLRWDCWSSALLLSMVYIFMTSIIGGDPQPMTIALLTHHKSLYLLMLCLFASPSLSGASPPVTHCRHLSGARCYLHIAVVQSHLK